MVLRTEDFFHQRLGMLCPVGAQMFWKGFEAFIRAYSTPLQPVLNSRGAAERHMGDPDFVRTGGTYPVTSIPMGQLGRFLQLQKRPWQELPRRCPRPCVACSERRSTQPRHRQCQRVRQHRGLFQGPQQAPAG